MYDYFKINMPQWIYESIDVDCFDEVLREFSPKTLLGLNNLAIYSFLNSIVYDYMNYLENQGGYDSDFLENLSNDLRESIFTNSIDSFLNEDLVASNNQLEESDKEYFFNNLYTR